jgi:hypothetical protein
MSNDAQGLFGEDGSIGESGPGESDMKNVYNLYLHLITAEIIRYNFNI